MYFLFSLRLIKRHVLNTRESRGTDPRTLNFCTKLKSGQLHFADALTSGKETSVSIVNETGRALESS
jgi:hypothetical protein